MKRNNYTSSKLFNNMVSGTSLKISFLYSLIYCLTLINASADTTPITPSYIQPTEEYPKYEQIDVSYLKKHENDNITKTLISESRSDDFSELNFSNETIVKNFLSSGNALWDSLIQECIRKPTISCIQKNVFTYLQDTLETGDLNVTNRLVFKKNKVDYHKYTKEANEDDNEIPDDSARSDFIKTPIEEVTDALYGKGVKFMMTHDVELKMPDMMFDGATFKISPRSIEGNGIIAKLEFITPQEIEARAVNLNALRIKPQGRIFFKKIKKFFKNKLLLAFLAIVLVIKIIKIKLMWLLPLIVGVTTAKKLVLKFLLFLFPALSQIFKLCSWYHHSYHKTNFHHHQHHINHLHTVVPQWIKDDHHEHHDHHDHHDHGHHDHAYPGGPELIYTSPPKGHPSEYLHGGPQIHQHHQPDWEFSGPGLGSEYIADIHRHDKNAHANSFKPKIDDAKEINSWGLGITSPLSKSYKQNPFVQEPSRIINPRPVASVLNPVYVPSNSPLHRKNPVASQIAQQYNSNDHQIREAQRLQQETAFRIQAEQQQNAIAQQMLQQQPFLQEAQAAALMSSQPTDDPFYGPILAKIDKTFLQLGFHEEGCRERLVCSMYKNPSKYTPHSNFVSAELSRDSSELQKASSPNKSVVRFYRYVQAARDGQDQKDCLAIYQQCNLSTER